MQTMHLLDRKGLKGGHLVFCGKVGVPVQQIAFQHTIHLVTCCDCLRTKIERLENELDEAWMHVAGAFR